MANKKVLIFTCFSVSLVAMGLLVGCGDEGESVDVDAGVTQQDSGAGGRGGDGGGNKSGGAGGIQTGGSAGSAGGQDLTGGQGGADPDPDVNQCDPGGMISPPLKELKPVAAYITSAQLKESFEQYAQLHTLFGKTSIVVTTEEICAGKCDNKDPKKDTAFHIKKWIKDNSGIKYVLLAGDIEHVPSRKVHDTFENKMVGIHFDSDFYTDYYFSDLSEWDTNGDGIYAQDGKDTPAYRPDVAVTRIPVSNKDEAALYYEKLLRYYTSYVPAKVDQVLMLTNYAMTYEGIQVDSAYYFESAGRTKDIVEKGYTPDNIKRLYAAAINGSEGNTLAKQISEINKGYNIILHSGHGAVDSLTTEQDGSNDMTAKMASELTNTTYPIFLSCACEAGTFAANDSAGEMLMNAPAGGAIAYMGNTAVGLGIAGGMQLIDEFVRYVVEKPNPILADAYFEAHLKMPEKDTFVMPKVGVTLPVVDKDSYEWTQKTVTLFGDFLIPVRKGSLKKAVSIKIKKKRTCEGYWYEFTINPVVEGTVRVTADGAYYDVILNKEGYGRVHLEKETAVMLAYLSPGRQATVITNKP